MQIDGWAVSGPCQVFCARNRLLFTDLLRTGADRRAVINFIIHCKQFNYLVYAMFAGPNRLSHSEWGCKKGALPDRGPMQTAVVKIASHPEKEQK